MRIGLAEVMFVGIVLALLSIPPTLGWVPRNRLYGFRVPATLRSDRVWYAINRRFGLELIVIGALLAIMAVVFAVAGFDTPVGRGIAVTTMFSSLLATTARGWRAANAIEKENGPGPVRQRPV